MPMFCFKRFASPKRTGEKLKEAREKKKWQIAEAATTTRIPKKYLLAIEHGEFQNLPPTKAHQLAYIKKYAETVGVNPKELLGQFIKEACLEDYRPIHPLGNLKIKQVNSIFVWMQKIFIAALVAGFIGYVAWQINGILQPPKLVVFSPDEGHVSNKITTTVQGKTDNEVKLTINGKEIMANDNGWFEVKVDLSKGINTITISAIKKHGKTTTITRHVIVKPK